MYNSNELSNDCTGHGMNSNDRTVQGMVCVVEPTFESFGGFLIFYRSIVLSTTMLLWDITDHCRRTVRLYLGKRPRRKNVCVGTKTKRNCTKKRKSKTSPSPSTKRIRSRSKSKSKNGVDLCMASQQRFAFELLVIAFDRVTFQQRLQLARARLQYAQTRIRVSLAHKLFEAALLASAGVDLSAPDNAARQP